MTALIEFSREFPMASKGPSVLIIQERCRLNRDFGLKRWGVEGYAMGELVGALGSAFLCADLELAPEVWAYNS